MGKPEAAAGKAQTAAATAEQTDAGSRHRRGDAVTVEQRRLHETLLRCMNTAAVNADGCGFGNADRRNGCGGGVGGHAVGEVMVMVGCRMVVMQGVLRRQQLLDRGPRHLHNTETLSTHRLAFFPFPKEYVPKELNLFNQCFGSVLYLFLRSEIRLLAKKGVLLSGRYTMHFLPTSLLKTE